MDVETYPIGWHIEGDLPNQVAVSTGSTVVTIMHLYGIIFTTAVGFNYQCSKWVVVWLHSKVKSGGSADCTCNQTTPLITRKRCVRPWRYRLSGSDACVRTVMNHLQLTLCRRDDIFNGGNVWLEHQHSGQLYQREVTGRSQGWREFMHATWARQNSINNN